MEAVDVSTRVRETRRDTIKLMERNWASSPSGAFIMAITNADIVEIWKRTIEAQEKRDERLTQTVDKFISENASNHERFNKAIADISTVITLLQAEQERHTANWQGLWKIVIAGIVIPVLLALVALVLR